MAKKSNNIITGYKAFYSDFTYRGQQFCIGSTYDIDKCVGVDKSLFCFCPDFPIDALRFTMLIDDKRQLSKFAQVHTDTDSLGWKEYETYRETSKITIDKEVTLDELIITHIDKIYSSVKRSKYAPHVSVDNNALLPLDTHGTMSASGYRSQIVSRQWHTKASISGDLSSIAVCGYRPKLTSSGDRCLLLVVGNEAEITARGRYPIIYASGEGANITLNAHSAFVLTGGEHSQITSSGFGSRLVATHNSSRIVSTGDADTCICYGQYGDIFLGGRQSRFRGAEGTLITAVIRSYLYGPPRCSILTGRIGEKDLKPDTFYRVFDGRFVALEDE